MNLTPEERKRGRENYYGALGASRRDFLKAAIAVPAVGAFYFGYKNFEGEPVRAGIIGTGGQGRELIKESNPEYVRFVAFSDIRPSNQEKAREMFRGKYGEPAAAEIKFFENYQDLLQEANVEMVVIATPLVTHAPIAIDALNAGKHVFCEKLMAKTIGDGKQMVHEAEKNSRLLAIGHQRHYSALYDNALHLATSGVLGDVKHIRALWHRNQTWPKLDEKGEVMKDAEGREILNDSWRPQIADADRSVDFGKYGYTSLEELVRWRLFNRTSAGLMAELGSHQLDACSLFLQKEHPVAVSGVGGKYYFTDNREAEDHVYVTYEFSEGRVVTYSSICTNAFESYGEIVMGTRGTLIVEAEKDVMLFKERDPGKKEPSARAMDVSLTTTSGGASALTSESPSGPAQAALAQLGTGEVSRGYREELEHFAYCVRNPSSDNQPRCNGRVALADAVMALVANYAMRRHERIEFKPTWFDADSPEVPEDEPATT